MQPSIMGKSHGGDSRDEVEGEDKGEGVIVSDSLPFNSWLGECITNRISLESPGEACVLASFLKSLELEANSDTVWETFLPQDYKLLVPRWREFSSKKELYYALCNNPVWINDGEKRLWLDKTSGKKCIILPAMDLIISWGNDLRYWDWYQIPEARFGKLAKLIEVCWFDIRGTINTRLLSPATRYSAYIVFKKMDGCRGFMDISIEAIIKEVGKEPSRRLICFDEVTYRRNIVKPEERKDGWMEIELGEFFTEEVLHSNEIEIRVVESKTLNWKGGLIILGIEIRPASNAERKDDSEVMKEIGERALHTLLNRNVVDVQKVLEYIPAQQTEHTIDKYFAWGATPGRSSPDVERMLFSLTGDLRTLTKSLMDGKITPPQTQVFISFRGDQLRNNFVGYLVHALQRGKVNVYIDNHEQRGEDLDTLFKRIENSGIAIVVFSTRYTESKWCLNELVKIKERVHQGLLKVLPIFYKVSPTDVKRLKGEFGDYFRDKEFMYKYDEPKIKRWKEAILFVSHKFALTFDDKSGVLEIYFVEKIVKAVLKMLQSVSKVENRQSSDRYLRSNNVGKVGIHKEKRVSKTICCSKEKHNDLAADVELRFEGEKETWISTNKSYWMEEIVFGESEIYRRKYYPRFAENYGNQEK